MMKGDPKKHGRAAEIYKQLAAEFIARNSNRTSLITVTGINLSDDEKNATILLTVFPDDKEKGVLDFLSRNLNEFRDFVKKKSSLRSLPRFEVEIDMGEKNRQLIDRLSRDS